MFPYVALRIGGQQHLWLISTELTRYSRTFNITDRRLGFGGKGGGIHRHKDTDSLFFLFLVLGVSTGWIHLACLRHSAGKHGVSVVGVGNRGAVYGGLVGTRSWKRGGGLIFHCGQCGGYRALFSFHLSPFLYPVRSLGQDTAQYTHTHNGWDCKRSGNLVVGGGMDWDARGGCGISYFCFFFQEDGRGWSGLFFFFGTGKQHPSCTHHITSPHDGTSTLHCTAPTLLDGGRTSGQGYRLASSVGPAASLSTTSLVIQHTKLLSLSSFVGLLAACVEIIGGRGGVGSCHHGYISSEGQKVRTKWLYFILSCFVLHCG